ncbi:MAG TPA: citryl-CoA lyase [Polyangiaceae bacterium]|nr:citryl-CoA lyase [Polyangiaceae bacterium]
MSPLPESQTTSLATSTAEDVFIRDQSLCHELIGKLSFSEMAFFLILGRKPTRAQHAVVDACLVTLMEHGLTPSAITTRLTYTSAPEAMQAAVAAGLMGVGSLFAGTTEGCALLLDRIVAAGVGADSEAERVAREHREARRPLPGFGHPLHKPDDPRALRLLELVEEHQLTGDHTRALLALSRAVDQAYGKHITINATGAIAAALGDCGVPSRIMRGFALIARCAGLVAHVHEEQQKPALRALWEAGERAVLYDGKQGR